MMNFLITLYLPEEHARILESLTRSALTSFEICGPIKHVDLGVFRHVSSKGSGADLLKLITISLENGADGTGEDLASNVESSLRSLLKSARVPPNDRVRVFIANQGQAPKKEHP
jgi:hypothetical protein